MLVWLLAWMQAVQLGTVSCTLADAGPFFTTQRLPSQRRRRRSWRRPRAARMTSLQAWTREGAAARKQWAPLAHGRALLALQRAPLARHRALLAHACLCARA